MKYATIKYNDIANGEGVRTSLFVSGCNLKCPGCFNKIAQDFNYGNEFTKDIQDQIIESVNKSYISGLTILGGEPFDPKNQPYILEFIKYFKTKSNKSIWIYTGYNYEKDLLKGRANTEYTNEILSLINVLIDGPFIESLKDPMLKFRGSSNQRILKLR